MRDDQIFADPELRRRILRLGFRRGAGIRRGLTTVVMLGAHFGVVVLTRVARWWDRIVHPGVSQTPVEQPVFIIAGPRSGTTFLHRLMCFDDDFAYLKLYQTLVPSSSLSRVVDGLSRSFLGRGLGAVTRWFERMFFSGWDGIHHLGFNEAEEDEGLFTMTLLSAGIFLLVPEIDEMHRAYLIDDIEEPTRDRLMAFHRGSLQRLMYVEGQERQFLGKSVLLPGRIETLLKEYPDMRFINLVRDPCESIPSFLSMFRAPWRFHSPHIPDNSPQVRALAELLIEGFRRFHDVSERLGPDRVMTMRYVDLIADPKAKVLEVYRWLGREPSEAYLEVLERETAVARKYKSKHHYSLEQFGLTEADIREPLAAFCRTHGFLPAAEEASPSPASGRA